MIKTLRITIIATAILAGLLFISPVFFGVRADEEAEQFLNSPGVVEKLKQAKVDKQTESQSQSSPLVKQAEAFALYLNPPPEPTRANLVRQQAIIPPKPPKAYAKFSLIGTSVHATKPEESLAFINEPGKGLLWVKPGSKLGHVTVEQIKDGLIICQDEQGNSEQILAEPRQPELSLLDGSASSAARVSPWRQAGPSAGVSVGASSQVASHLPTATSGKATAGVTISRPPMPQLSAKDSAALEDLIEKLKAIQSGSASDKTGSPGSGELNAAMMEKLISDFKTTHIDAQEAEKLGNLGKELNGLKQDPNRPQESRNKRQIGLPRRLPLPPKTQ